MRLAGSETGNHMTTMDDDRDPQAERLEQMKNEFLVAQQRRRERAAPGAPSRHDDAGNEPPLAGPVADSQVAVQPSN